MTRHHTSAPAHHAYMPPSHGRIAGSVGERARAGRVQPMSRRAGHLPHFLIPAGVALIGVLACFYWL